MRVWHAVLAALALALAVEGATAAEVFDRVRSRGTVRCGAVERPGLLDMRGGRHPAGLFVDLCRAIAVAALGSGASIEVRAYDSDTAFDAVRTGGDDVFFLSGAEIVAQHLAGHVLPGPTAFTASTSVMVPGTSTAKDIGDLAGEPVCFEQGTSTHRDLEALFAARHLTFVRMGFQEPDEMVDAYDSRLCHALAGETTGLAALRHGGGSQRSGSRLLPTFLARFPIVAATGLQDASWSAFVAWSLDTLQAADIPNLPWRASGTADLPLPDISGPQAGWQQRMVAAVGGYGAMVDRAMGSTTPLGLARGPNALLEEGGSYLPPSAN